MVGSKHVRLRVGVIGLGRLWETRHKPSLARLEDRFRVTAVYDPVYRRAELEAAQIGCAACEGLAALVERPDVDVDLPVVAPVVRAASDRTGLRRGQAGLLRVAAGRRPGRAGIAGQAGRTKRDRLHARVRPALLPGDLAAQGAAGDPVGPAAPGRGTYPALRIRPLCDPGPDDADRSGPALDRSRQLLCSTGAALSFSRSPRLCTGFGARSSPRRTQADQEADFESFVATFSGGATAQISYGRYHRAPWGDASRFLPPPGFQVFAERGAAWLEMPEKIQWSNAAGTKEERLALEPTVGDVLNDQFHRLVRGDHSLAPTIREALEIARLVDDLRRCSARTRPARNRPIVRG